MGFDSQPHLVEIVAALKEITARITAASALPEAIDDLLEVTAGVLPGHVQGGITMISQGEPAAFASTGLPTQILDETLHAHGDGPGMEAIRTRGIVLSQDLATETRWPIWSEQAQSQGVHGVLSYPFDVDTLTLGAFNLYANRPQAFTDELPIIAMLIADHASLLLHVRLRQFSHDDLLSQVNDVPAGTATVERAVGIVMAQRGCPPDQALRHLYEAAAQLGVGLSIVAERLVRTVGDRGAAPPA